MNSPFPNFKWAGLFLGVFVLIQSAGASPSTLAFETANKLYYENKFTDAITAYRQILQTNGETPALHFNLGNAYFKSGQLGRAVAAYREAESLAPRDPDIRANLQFARKQVNGSSWTWNRWENALRRLTLNEWTLIFTCVAWILLIILSLAQWRPEWKLSTSSPLLVSAILLVLSGICLAGNWQLNQNERLGVVVTADLSVRHGPLPESPEAFILHDGAEVRVLDRRNDWLQVSLNPEKVGWAPRDKLLLEIPDRRP